MRGRGAAYPLELEPERGRDRSARPTCRSGAWQASSKTHTTGVLSIDSAAGSCQTDCYLGSQSARRKPGSRVPGFQFSALLFFPYTFHDCSRSWRVPQRLSGFPASRQNRLERSIGRRVFVYYTERDLNPHSFAYKANAFTV